MVNHVAAADQGGRRSDAAIVRDKGDARDGSPADANITNSLGIHLRSGCEVINRPAVIAKVLNKQIMTALEVEGIVPVSDLGRSLPLAGRVDRQHDEAPVGKIAANLHDITRAFVAAAAVLQQHRRALSRSLLRDVEEGGHTILLDAVELNAKLLMTRHHAHQALTRL